MAVSSWHEITRKHLRICKQESNPIPLRPDPVVYKSNFSQSMILSDHHFTFFGEFLYVTRHSLASLVAHEADGSVSAHDVKGAHF